jgi:hypothetical protein
MPDTEHLLYKTRHLYNSNLSRDAPYPRDRDFPTKVTDTGHQSLPRNRSLPMSAGSNHNFNRETQEFINIDYRSGPQNPNPKNYQNFEEGDPDAYQ